MKYKREAMCQLCRCMASSCMLKKKGIVIINHNKLMTDRCTDNGFEEGQECYIKKILEKEKI